MTGPVGVFRATTGGDEAGQRADGSELTRIRIVRHGDLPNQKDGLTLQGELHFQGTQAELEELFGGRVAARDLFTLEVTFTRVQKSKSAGG